MADTIRYAVVRWDRSYYRAAWIASTEVIDFAGRVVHITQAVGELANIPVDWEAEDLRHCVTVKTDLQPEAIAVCEVARG